jgi:hypothetical protein
LISINEVPQISASKINRKTAVLFLFSDM